MPAKTKPTAKKPASPASQPAAPASAPTPETPAPAAPAVSTPPAAPVVETTDDELMRELEKELGIAGDETAGSDDDTNADETDDAADDTQLPATDDDTDEDTPPADDAHAAGGDAGNAEHQLGPDGEAASDDDQPDPDEQPDPAAARIAALEAQLAELKAKLEAGAAAPSDTPHSAFRTPQSFSSAEDEVAAAETEADLLKLQARFQRLEDLAADNPDGYEGTNASGETITYTPEQIRAIGRSAKLALRAIPRQAQHLQRRAAFNAFADKSYKDFANPKSDLARYYETMRRDRTPICQLPYLKLVLADAERGRLAREAEEKAAAEAAKGDGRPGVKVAPVARRAAPVLPTAGARKPAPVAAAQAKRAAAAKRLAASNGSADDLARSLEDEL